MSLLSTTLSLLCISADGVSKDLLNETTVLVEAVKLAQADNKLNKNFLGTTNEEYIEVSEWLSASAKPLDAVALIKLNDLFSTKSYLVNQNYSLADVAVFVGLHTQNQLTAITTLSNLARWFNHIQNIVTPNVLPLVFIPTTSFIIPFPVLSTPAPLATTPATVPTVVAEATTTPATTEVKKEKKEDIPAKKNDEKKEKTKTPKEDNKPTAPTPATTETDADADPSKLDIRVGVVVKCWNHPESDKLLCEEIDLGETATRTIASGIRAYYTAEEVQGRKVLVVANLKERNMANFKSQGMVLCASKKEDGVVKFVEVPSVAKVGERVVFEGFAGEPASASQVAKKKVLEGLMPGFRTDSEGVVLWKESVWTIGGEKVTAPVVDATVG